MDASLHYNIWLYAAGYTKLETLENWYVPRLEEFVSNPDTTVIVSQLELGLVELEEGLITEEELKRDLKEMIIKHLRKNWNIS